MSATVWPIVPAPDDEWLGAVGEMSCVIETEVSEENLPQIHFKHHKSNMNWPR
jgi:hypothetical protein